MKNNTMYEGVFKLCPNTKTIRDIKYENAENCEEGNTKIIVIPYLTIGENIINVLVEYYMADYVCKRPGKPAANGWHEYPTFGYRWNKKPYSSQVMSIEMFEKMFKNVLLNEIA